MQARHPIEALILAAGAGQRVGGQPKAFLRLGSQTVLERIVGLALALGGAITVAVRPEDVSRAESLLGGTARVIGGGETRNDTFRALVGRAGADSTVVVLDVAHPLTSLDLTRRVVGAAGPDGAAVAVGRAYDQVLLGDATAVAEPGESYLLRKPFVFQRTAIMRGLAIADERQATGAPNSRAGVLDLLRLAGVGVALVEAEPWNVKLTTQQDWEMIQLLAAIQEPRPTSL